MLCVRCYPVKEMIFSGRGGKYERKQFKKMERK
jgi:hypothetical protein